MQDKKLYKSRTDKKINGVCGGIAKYVGIDATAIRLAWGFLNCVYGSGVIAYRGRPVHLSRIREEWVKQMAANLNKDDL